VERIGGEQVRDESIFFVWCAGGEVLGAIVLFFRLDGLCYGDWALSRLYFDPRSPGIGCYTWLWDESMRLLRMKLTSPCAII
jgi:hypothetical protein